MATQSTNVLSMLKDIAAKEVELATKALAQAMKMVDEAQSKHDLLREYRQEYTDNFNKLLTTGIGTEIYQNFQNFFRKLDQAIAGQQTVIESAKQQVKAQRAVWQESQRKKLSYEVLSQRSDNRALKIEQKKDQKVMDEFAMRINRTGRS